MEHALGLEEMRLVEGLRNRDEQAFEQLIRMYQSALVRVAQMYVSSRAIAEEALTVKETGKKSKRPVDPTIEQELKTGAISY